MHHNVGQIRAWSLPHLKIGSWYIDYDKGFCLEECGNTDSNFFALDTKIVPKLGNLRFGNSKTGKMG
jgi:hypothetical protein